MNCFIFYIKFFHFLFPIYRITWSIFLALATLGVIYVSILLSQRYQTSPLSTVVETTNFHISEIPFPAISICNSNRLNYNKLLAAAAKFYPESLNDTNKFETFLLMMQILDTIDFGSFQDMIPVYEQSNWHDLLNLRQIFEFMMATCYDIFDNCWWRNKYIDCCAIFAMQRTEYGICLSFNSASSSELIIVNVFIVTRVFF